MERESSSCSQAPNVKGKGKKIFALKGGKSEKRKTKPKKRKSKPNNKIPRYSWGGERRKGRESEKGFSCAGADTVRLHFQRSGSGSGVPLSSSAIFLGVLREHCGFSRAALPGLCEAAPGARDLPLPLAQTPPEGWAAPLRDEGGRRSPLRSPKSLSVQSSPQNGLERRGFGKPVERMDVICVSKRS